jgi:hypothetical protein
MTRQLDIVFYGMTCFDAVDGGYRVLLPDGRDAASMGIPVHNAAIWIRNRDKTAAARWDWPSQDNDFLIGDPCELQVTGANATELDTSGFEERLANLTDSDPNFTLADEPEAVVEMFIDRGTLTAHQFPTGMILVKWRVEIEDNSVLRFDAGRNWIEVPPDADQVVIANAGTTSERSQRSRVSHFRLFRKLATEKTGNLEPQPPRTRPQQFGVALIQPSHNYMIARSPRVDCSGVFAR